MSEQNDDANKNWSSKQNWIKDVFSKSGTELMKITTTVSKNNSTKNENVSTTSTASVPKKVAKKNVKEIRRKMVYYQSTPLMIKSEQPSQAQFCTPLRSTTTNATTANTASVQQQSNVATTYNTHNGTIAIVMQQQQHQQQQQLQITETSIDNTQLQQQQQQQQQQLQQSNFNIEQNKKNLLNSKFDPLLPSISIYPTTSPTLANTSSPSTLSASRSSSSITLYNATSNNSSSNILSTAVLAPANTIAATTTTLSQPAAAAALPPLAATTVPRKTINTNKPQFKCEQCGMSFGSKSAHTSHTKSHSNKNGQALQEDLYDGPSTSAQARRLMELNEVTVGGSIGIPKTPQIRQNINGAVNGSDPYQCNVCQKTFAVPARLIRHYRTHTGERPFECEFCHKLFSVKENLQVHRRIHTKERPYKCDVCGRAFEHSGKLHRHMRIHTGERPHKCNVCAKTFIQSGQLVIHMRTHTGEKPYRCPEPGCGKGFTCSKQLKVHSRTHTGEKPYHCDICFRDFGYNHVLKLHRVQHYGAKCYKCTICEETFKSKKEMEAHIKGHANEMPDDDDDANPSVNGSDNTHVSGSSVEATSEPGSPQSSTSNAINNIASKTRKFRQDRKRSVSSAPLTSAVNPQSPSSSRSTLSPSSTLTSASCLSAGSPASASIASPSLSSLLLETDHHSRDSGIVSSNRHQLTASSSSGATMNMSNNQSVYVIDEMPTDLSIPQQEPTKYYLQQEQQQQQQQQSQTLHHQTVQQQQSPQLYQHSQNSPVYHQQHQQQQHPAYSTYIRQSPDSPAHHHQLQPPQQLQQQLHTTNEPLATINPALLEAASIASRRAMLEPREEDVTQAALQIMQLHRSQTQQQHGQHEEQQQMHEQSQVIDHHSAIAVSSLLPSTSQYPLLASELSHYHDDTREANELIDHYRRGDLARHGIHRGYAPVPQFEPSLRNNEIIVRQVEAAIAPLRSSTESPERSSSPESDSMMMADRDVMTLPLRKRKLYMNEGSPNEDGGPPNTGGGGGSNAANAGGNNGGSLTGEINGKAIRISSVIQFAKAS